VIVAGAASAARLKADVLLLPVVEGVKRVPSGVAGLDEALSGGLQSLLTATRGRLGEVTDTLTLGRLGPSRLALVGLGPEDVLDRVRLGNSMQIAVGRLGRPRTWLAVQLDPGLAPGVDPGELAEAAVEAAVLAGFSQATMRATRERKGREDRTVRRLTLIGFSRLDRPRMEAAAVVAEATNLARGLVNSPPSALTPEAFAAKARRSGAAAGLKVEVLGPAELKGRGYGAILAVGGGSVAPPRMVTLTYTPSRAARSPGGRLLALVGKGITFDSGGISIKPANDLHFMKGDMGGAAAVLGAMTAIGRLKPPVPVVGILCLAENMVSDRAMRPGDVVRSGAGITIEVTNTDAEGRMVLADGIHHAVGLGATDIVDIATLTGGQRVALGPVAAAIMSDAPGLESEVTAAAAAAGERVWPLPTFAEYEGMLESPIADLNNSPGPNASAITAGLFLKRFAAGTRWLHIDMAAPSWNRVPGLSEVPSGPSGFGVRLLTRLALTMGAKR
jgi:leucyl aminopeptidase